MHTPYKKWRDSLCHHSSTTATLGPDFSRAPPYTTVTAHSAAGLDWYSRGKFRHHCPCPIHLRCTHISSPVCDSSSLVFVDSVVDIVVSEKVSEMLELELGLDPGPSRIPVPTLLTPLAPASSFLVAADALSLPSFSRRGAAFPY